MCINKQFENTLNISISFDVPTQSFVLLPVEWDKKGLLFTKQLHIMI